MQEPARAIQEAGTEKRILAAARTIFLKRGTAAARMLEIASEAQVNPALLHYYFRSKSRLAHAVFEQAIAELFPPVAEVLTSELKLEEKVRRVVAIELDLLSRNPYLPAYIIGEINSDPKRALQLVESASRLQSRGILTRMLKVLRRQIQARVKSGSMREISAEQFIANLLSLCIFPFATKPLMQTVLQLSDKGFKRFIAERKADLPVFFLNALRC
jgi:TetR/AcrR family transcriptional regulator